MQGKLISVAVSTALAFTLAACGGGGGSSSGEPTKQEVSIESSSISYALTSVYSGVEQSQRGVASQRELKIYTGELLAVNAETQESKTYNWSAYINDETFDVVSNKTIVLEPGNYEFTLNLRNGNNQYISETVYEVKDADQINIPFNLKPIIGSIITDVTVIEEMPSMKLKYDVGEISAYSNPRVGISVDGEAKQYLNINPETGLSDVYLSILEGDHEITLDFYDGNQYLGRSSQYPANVTVTSKQDLNIDLVALHGEATLGFDVNESKLNMTINIPSQVVVESEGIDNLSTLIRYSDSNVTVEKEITNLIENGSDYQGSITLEDIHYGEFAFSLIFSDKSDNNELIGSCDVEPFTISENETNVNCELSLKKRSNITGNLLATVGINVFNETMEPIAGAELYLDDDYLGLTGSGDFGTEGYLKQYIKKGNYTLKAQKDGKEGSKEVDLGTLSLNNFDLVLDQDPIVCIQGDGSENDSTTSAVPILTSNTSHGLAFASHVYRVDDEEPWKAFDGIESHDSYWYGFPTEKVPTFVGYKFEEAKVINKYNFKPYQNTENYYSPLSWTIEGSNNTTNGEDGDWEVLDSVTTEAIARYDGTFINSKAYLAYRVHTTEVSRNGSAFESLNFIEAQEESCSNNSFNGYGKPWKSIHSASKKTLDLTTITTLDELMPYPIIHGESFKLNDEIYMFGYFKNSTYYGGILKAPINNPTQWIETSKVLAQNIKYPNEILKIDNFLYSFGGYNTKKIIRASIDNPTQWEDTGGLSPFTEGSQIAVIDDFIYLFGGYNGTEYSRKIMRASITDPTNWEDTGKSLPIIKNSNQLVILENYLYIFGGGTANLGGDPVSNILRAPISDPTSWKDTGSKLPTALYMTEVAIIGENIYLFGGRTSNSTSTDKIYIASIDSPLEWTITDSTLNGQKGFNEVIVLENNVYFLGGYSGSTHQKKITKINLK